MNDRIVAIWIVVGLIVGVTFFGFLTDAYGDYFRTIGVYHKTNPVVCIMYPDPEKENIELLTDLTHSSIDEWQTKLVNATNGNWQMFILEYEWSEHATAYVEEFPHCTIFVNYIHLTTDESVGRTGWDFSKSVRYYYWIEVDTHTIENRVQIELNETGGKVWSEEVIMELPENDLRNVILHEFGHALGVEHYYITTNCIKEECDYSPIMFSSVDLFEGVVKNVTEKDLDMVIRIYGEDGYGHPKPVVIPRHCEIIDTEFCPIVR